MVTHSIFIYSFSRGLSVDMAPQNRTVKVPCSTLSATLRPLFRQRGCYTKNKRQSDSASIQIATKMQQRKSSMCQQQMEISVFAFEPILKMIQLSSQMSARLHSSKCTSACLFLLSYMVCI